MEDIDISLDNEQRLHFKTVAEMVLIPRAPVNIKISGGVCCPLTE